MQTNSPILSSLETSMIERREGEGMTEFAIRLIRHEIIEECAKVLDEAAQDWNRIRDPGMANNARSYAMKIRKLADR